MSKSFQKLTGTNTVKYDNSGAQNLINYLQSVNTSNVDNTLSNMTTTANSMSQNLENILGNYTFNIDGSDEARQRALNATYQSYIDKLTPQFQNQTSDLATSLQNKGLAVGSEAYSRAMNDLQSAQNDALNQAVYQAVLNGQNAFSQSISDQVNTGNYTATANQNYINLLQSLLNGSQSEYDKQMDIYAAANNIAGSNYAAEQQMTNNRLALINSLLGSGSKIIGS